MLAAVGSAILGLTTYLLTRKLRSGRRRAIVAAVLLPPTCLVWAAVMFVFQAVVNEGLLNRDLGAGDTWHAPLPNGYQVLMIDVTDQGWVYNPKSQKDSIVVTREDSVSGVRELEVADRYILGGTDSKAFEQLGKGKGQVDGYFILDTDIGKRTEFQSYDSLRQNALQIGIDPHLQPINDVYSKYRFSWFDVFAGLVFILPPIAAVVLLGVWIVRIRRRREMTSLAS
ncbi:MAG: hypothetical protein JST28_17665 [Acidobacteria bacterium]|nr:hypothetical protein [Acidobacteriota bacterium]